MPETLTQAHRRLARRLAGAGIEPAMLDARLLLQQALGLGHEAFLAAPGRAIAAEELRLVEDLVERRLAGEPVSRIAGWREFYGRRFAIGPAVLDPRPETELLIDIVLALLRQRPRGSAARLLDLGTGSGIIAITALAEWPGLTALATDVDVAALAVARENAVRHRVADRLRLARSDWFDEVSGRFDVVAGNPPYVASGEIGGLERDVRDHDPRKALDGGHDGLDAYRIIARGVGDRLSPGGHAVLEIGHGQGAAVCRLLADQGLAAPGNGGAVRRDLAGSERIVHMVRPSRPALAPGGR